MNYYTINSEEAHIRALLFIYRHMSDYGYPPSVREVAQNVGFNSPSSGAKIMNGLRRREWIEVDMKIARGVRISESGMAIINSLIKS